MPTSTALKTTVNDAEAAHSAGHSAEPTSHPPLHESDVMRRRVRVFESILAPMSEQPPVRRIMISSTALDLPEHRRHARDACERMSMLPLVMEQMPASPADALALSRDYVDKAEFYMGIFAFRYGFVPEGQKKSITELEYDRAIKRGIPAFI